jgi:hypothetical protein
MVDMTIIDGGTPVKPLVTKKDAAERIKVFVSHLRAIEKSVSMVQRIAENMNWPELAKMARENHSGLLNTLSYVKNYEKKIANNLITEPKKDHLALIYSDEKED